MDPFANNSIFGNPKLITILFLIFLVGFWIGKSSERPVSVKEKDTTNRKEVDQVQTNTQEKVITEQA